MKCTYCGRGEVQFGEACRVCGGINRDNTQSLDSFWDSFKSGKRKRPAADDDDRDRDRRSFFSPVWAVPFKLLWLPVRLTWWLVKVPF